MLPSGSAPTTRTAGLRSFRKRALPETGPPGPAPGARRGGGGGGVALLREGGGAGDGAAGADAGDEVGDLAARLPPDLRPGGLVVGARGHRVGGVGRRGG